MTLPFHTLLRRSTPLLLLSLLLLCVTSLHAAAAAGPKKNVLFIMADDFRPELATYGSPAITPNLDKLAARSVQFDRAYCQQAVCNPSRSSMLTGLRPDTLRIWNNGTHFRELNPEVTTLPKWFMEHGYTSRCVGKIFHNWHTEMHGDPSSWSAPEFLHYANHGDDTPQVTGEVPPNTAVPGPRNYGNVNVCEKRDVPDEAYYDGRVAAEAVRVLTELKKEDKPFFLAVGFWKPHAPFNAPKKYWDLYDKSKLPTLNPARPAGAPEVAFHDSREILGPPKEQKPLTPEQVLEMRHGYFANISYMDAQLGKVLEALKAQGLEENTVITFAGDHGYHIGEHTQWGKTSNFEYDAQVPLMISGPKLELTGKRYTSPVELLDVFPTLVDLCELPKPPGLEGVSLVPALNGWLDAPPSKLDAFTQHPRPAYYDREPDKQPKSMGVSVRTATVRYTEWRDWKTGEVIARELYDHTKDPQELRNAIDDPSLAEQRETAAAALLKQFPITPHP
ncbi:sulfatase [Roseimicrobium sp. ORNL1]|uniref:sulfatase n=1 Tax=Roseimicrobium sp. ORNL1 TaxID=2711231 RepID=UPI0013E1C69C|nr:sulfatase [Roseimicrobium sp. ORNL1]QIF01132.1 sulfatase [Roseimicrobium sp. ORNL1]